MSLLDRYLGGDREQVWAELRALGPIERGHAQYDDARAVAAETMRRVRGNVEVVRTRLIDAGYQLVAQDRAHVPPTADAAAQLDAFERKHGPLPLSLRAFYEFVGTVNLMQSADQLVQWHKREVAPEPVPELRGGIAMDDGEVVGRELPDLAFTRRLAIGLQEIGDERRTSDG